MSDAALYKISLDTREKQFICNIEITQLPYSFQISNDTLIMPQTAIDESREDYFTLLNLNTLQTTTLPIYGVLYDLYYICEGDTIYYSYAGIIRDGSLNFTDKDNEHNGTWKINMLTGEEEKISDEIYTNLYCFDKTHLYGYSEKYGITEIVLN
jgi:predicted hydrolase (HD superfamily)